MTEQMLTSENVPVQDIIRGLIVPLHRVSLLIPNTLVAEVAAAKQSIPISTIPEWFIAMFEWRGRTVPLISFERMLGNAQPPSGNHTKTLILNTLNNDQALPFVGLVTQGVPRPLTVKDGMLNGIEKEGAQDTPVVLCHTSIRGESAIIPDMDMVERMILSAGIIK